MLSLKLTYSITSNLTYILLYQVRCTDLMLSCSNQCAMWLPHQDRRGRLFVCFTQHLYYIY